MSPVCGVLFLFGFTLGLMPHVSQRWWGGGLQRWVYNQKLVQYLNYIEKMTKAIFVKLLSQSVIYFVSEERKEIFSKTCWLLFIVCKGKLPIVLTL